MDRLTTRTDKAKSKDSMDIKKKDCSRSIGRILPVTDRLLAPDALVSDLRHDFPDTD